MAGAALGAKGGAVAGAAIGSVIPIVGTGAGAAVGGVIGAIGGGIVGSGLANAAANEVKGFAVDAGQTSRTARSTASTRAWTSPRTLGEDRGRARVGRRRA